MSVVTLETLRADFEAASEHRNSLGKVYYDAGGSVSFVAAAEGEPYRLLEAAQEKCVRANELWDIAEKHGIQAAMLYKLSNGNIDPRK